MMLSRYAISPFTNPVSVEVWDTWFRWREHGVLRDASIETTWQRVSAALSAVEATDPLRWSRCFFEAQASWRLLLDERILGSAGTPLAEWPEDPVALLNVARFVVAPLTSQATFAFDAFQEMASLALRAVDNALLARVGVEQGLPQPRVGLVGMGDALALLGKRYDSPAGRVTAGSIAQALAEGCLQANVRLAHERGGSCAAHDASLAAAHARDMPRDLLAEVARGGLRHAHATAIISQPRLALLANAVSDAIDPLDAAEQRATGRGTASRSIRSEGYAFALARRSGCEGSAAILLRESTHIPVAAQIDLRGAVQPWIDRPIEYPFRVSREPHTRAASHWQRLASAYQLGNLSWSHA